MDAIRKKLAHEGFNVLELQKAMERKTLHLTVLTAVKRINKKLKQSDQTKTNQTVSHNLSLKSEFGITSRQTVWVRGVDYRLLTLSSDHAYRLAHCLNFSD